MKTTCYTLLAGLTCVFAAMAQTNPPSAAQPVDTNGTAAATVAAMPDAGTSARAW